MTWHLGDTNGVPKTTLGSMVLSVGVVLCCRAFNRYYAFGHVECNFFLSNLDE
jgi:hypothetical protein